MLPDVIMEYECTHAMQETSDRLAFPSKSRRYGPIRSLNQYSTAREGI